MKSNSRILTLAAAGLFAFAIFAVLVTAWLIPRGIDRADAQSTTQNAPKDKGDEQAQPLATEAPKTTTITVRGSGVVTAKPDTIKMSVGVTVFDKTVKTAQDKAASITDSMVGKIKAAGVADADYRTGQYNVEPVMDYAAEKGGAPSQTPTLTGFRVTYILDITLRDTTKAPALIDDLVAAGANTVYGLTYTFNDQDSLSQQAYDAAVKDARARATKLAALSNLTLGHVLSVSDASANIPGPVYDAGGKGGGPGFYPGQQSIQSDLVVTFEATSK